MSEVDKYMEVKKQKEEFEKSLAVDVERLKMIRSEYQNLISELENLIGVEGIPNIQQKIVELESKLKNTVGELKIRMEQYERSLNDES